MTLKLLLLRFSFCKSWRCRQLVEVSGDVGDWWRLAVVRRTYPWDPTSDGLLIARVRKMQGGVLYWCFQCKRAPLQELKSNHKQNSRLEGFGDLYLLQEKELGWFGLVAGPHKAE
ncbi:hypothetical protein Dimus_033338 [Dionaea muscipula]